jgi:uncharacterized membrane protein
VKNIGEDRAMRIASVGHAVFAATLTALGIVGLIQGDFAPPWQPVPVGVPARQLLAYLCSLISLATGAGLLWQRTAAVASRVLLGWLLCWLLIFRVPVIYRAPAVEVSWEGWGETTVIVAGAWVLYAWFAAEWDREPFGFASGKKGVRIARALFGLALIPLGLAHLAYVKQTAALVPGWLPSREAWVYFTGCTYIVAGVAQLIGVCARLAAVLTAWQMGLFTLLVWVPIIATGTRDPFQWSETAVSWTLTAAAWVVADSYRGIPWLAVGRRSRSSATTAALG